MFSKLSKQTVHMLDKEWPNDVVHRYIGNFSSSYFAYAADQIFRENAASGGVTTALLTYLLKSGKIGDILHHFCQMMIRANLSPH